MGFNPDKVLPGTICEKDLCKMKEAVCIQVEKIYDSCKEKDCIENARVLFKDPDKVQEIIEHAINVKARNAEVVKVFSDVEPVPFKRGFYTVDVKFFIKVILEFFVPKKDFGIKVVCVPGLVLFDKKVILFGSEGNIKIFKSQFVEHHECEKPTGTAMEQSNLPISKVEVADPIALNAKFCELHEKHFDCDCEKHVPRSISDALEAVDFDVMEFEEEDDQRGHHHDHDCDPDKIVVVTIGLFSIIKLARLVQLLIPAFDFCVPNKKCIASTDEDPCELFETIEFPVDEFFPPQKCDFPGAEEEERSMLKE